MNREEARSDVWARVVGFALGKGTEAGGGEWWRETGTWAGAISEDSGFP